MKKRKLLIILVINLTTILSIMHFYAAVAIARDIVINDMTITTGSDPFIVTSPSPWTCGDSMVVVHTAGAVAPVTKTVTYATVSSALSGATKCWITQNLGADDQASSATDNDEASAGWYWQFNRQQGYKHDGTTLTPAWTITLINEASDWTAANDPCTILLGAGWRLPTSTEWTNADANGPWANYTDTYNSVLKLHAAGYLDSSNGALTNRGSGGHYCSSTQSDSANGWLMYFAISGSGISSASKAAGRSVRCLKD